MKKIAIVSSYDESCGNAYFTDVLITSINKSQTGWSAEAVGLNLNLNQSLGRLENKAADDDVKRIAEHLKKFAHHSARHLAPDEFMEKLKGLWKLVGTPDAPAPEKKGGK